MEIVKKHGQSFFRHGLIAASLLCLNAANVWAQKPRLPDEIRADLTSYLGQWRFVPNRTFDGDKCITQVTGDFDGNGQTDFAVYVRAGQGATETRRRLIVYLRTGVGFARRTLDKSALGNDRCLCLFRKGTKDYKYETQKYFHYQHDTVGLIYPAKAGDSYVYWRGRFYRITTSD